MKSKKEIKKLYPGIKEMYEKGCTIKEIATTLDVSKEAIYNAITVMNIPLRKKNIVEPEIKVLMYADNTPPILEKMIIGGKRYTDVTPIFSPR